MIGVLTGNFGRKLQSRTRFVGVAPMHFHPLKEVPVLTSNYVPHWNVLFQHPQSLVFTGNANAITDPRTLLLSEREQRHEGQNMLGLCVRLCLRERYYTGTELTQAQLLRKLPQCKLASKARAEGRIEVLWAPPRPNSISIHPSVTVSTRISVAALIKFFPPPLRRLFESGSYLRVEFI